MSDKEMIIDVVSQFSHDASIEEISREIEFLAGIKVAQEQAHRGEGISIEEARERIKVWARQSS